MRSTNTDRGPVSGRPGSGAGDEEWTDRKLLWPSSHSREGQAEAWRLVDSVEKVQQRTARGVQGSGAPVTLHRELGDSLHEVSASPGCRIDKKEKEFVKQRGLHLIL